MTEPRYVPATYFVAVPVKRLATGQEGVAYVLPTQVAAVMEVDSQVCRVLLAGSSEWMQVDLSADGFLSAIGGVAG